MGPQLVRARWAWRVLWSPDSYWGNRFGPVLVLGLPVDFNSDRLTQLVFRELHAKNPVWIPG